MEGDDEDNFQAYSEQTSIPVKWGEVGPEVPRELPAIPTLSAEDIFGLEKSCWGDDLSASKHAIIEDPNQVIAVGAGDNFCAALKANGELWSLEARENDDLHKCTWRYVGSCNFFFEDCRSDLFSSWQRYPVLTCGTFPHHSTQSPLTRLPRHSMSSLPNYP